MSPAQEMSSLRQWRLISFSSHDAATNMALDEAILEAHIRGLVPATLRLYSFEPPAITIGRTQEPTAEMMRRACEKGFDVVRRPTGGRAVLHHRDLTYSFVASSGDGTLSQSISTSYKQICQALQDALNLLGIRLELGNARAEYRHVHDCFAATTGSDLHFSGKKMIGSAQCRRHGSVLQHGSILLEQEQGLMPELLGDDCIPGKSPARHANLFEITGRAYTSEQLENAMKAGFESAFNAQMQVSALSEWECDLAESLKESFLIHRFLVR